MKDVSASLMTGNVVDRKAASVIVRVSCGWFLRLFDCREAESHEVIGEKKVSYRGEDPLESPNNHEPFANSLGAKVFRNSG